MKAHLAKLSLALLSAVFLLGCQEQGSEPVGPVGPQFDKPGFGECDAAVAGDHCHGDDTEDAAETFNITVSSTLGHISSTLQMSTDAARNQIVANPFTLDLAFFEDKLTCGPTDAITGGEGVFTLNKGAEGEAGHAFIQFQFKHNDINHTFSLDGKIDEPANWLPTTAGESNFISELPAGNGHWVVKAQGRNHQNGCTGEGTGLVYMATVVPL